MKTLLVIDDEPSIRFTIEQVIGSPALTVFSAATAQEGLRIIEESSPQVVLLDIRLDDCSGLDLFKRIKRLQPKTLVIFITGHGSAETAIEAMKIGAFDYLVKPLDIHQLNQVIEQAFKISRLMHEPAAMEVDDQPADSSDRLVGSGTAMRSICKQIGRIAPQDVNAIVLGESGTGKELVARAIYQHSRRSQSPFVAINCAAIPETLLESELFGHERGAFTGADRRRVGKFEQAHGGTIFLDEVGDMPLATQAKMLRLLQEGQFERVGGNETLHVDVRVIAATNQNLEAMIESGKFRRDLYFRLRGVTLLLPPLRERLEDIPELAHYFLFRLNRQLGTSVQTIDQESLDLLRRYPWPGNVRELQSVIRESLIASTGPTLLVEFLPAALVQPVASSEPLTREAFVPTHGWSKLGEFVEHSLASGRSNIYREALQYFDQTLVGLVLKATDNNLAKAAEMLGISRPTLRAKLRDAREFENGPSSQD